MTAYWNSDKHASFNFSFSYDRGIETMGVSEHILQKSQLLKFTYISLGYMEEKSCNFCSFV